MTPAFTTVDETLPKRSRTDQRVPVGPTNSFVEFKKDEINQSIPARFEQQVNQYPDRVAIKTASAQFTYLELNRFANRIARAIVARNDSSTEPVALLIEQGSTLIAAILGVLKAGKFYVPLDSSFPERRLAAMVENSRPGLILADQQNLAAAGALTNGAIPVLTLEDLGDGSSSDNLDLAISPDAIGYILYTSGSTGKPKGVFQSHRNVLHAVMKYTNGAHLCATDRLTLLMSASFGASISDIFGALLNGAALLPFSLNNEGLLNLSNWLNREQVTICHSTPTVFRHLVATLKGTEDFSKLRLMKLGGESVHRKDFQEFKRYFPPTCLFQVGFGATEMNSICQYFCDHQSTFEGPTVPVGYVLDDTELLLLNGSRHEVSPGATGEIAIRSNYLALGYWGEPELTKKAFQSDSNDVGIRIYRTGDLGRMLPDGCLVHLGRKDHQLKIRGHRVEPAEVEMALRENQAVSEALVTGRTGQNGETQLVAYVVTRGSCSPSINDLRNSLKQWLSDYMIPTAFVMLDALPLTENGKVDRNALPPPLQERSNLGTTFVAPRDTLESEMARIWSDILGIGSIGIFDNFFSLGGDSLSAVQLVSQVSCSFQVELTMRALIESPTIAALTAKVQMLKFPPNDVNGATWTSLVTIQAGNSRPPFFLIPGGLGSDLEFFLYAQMVHHLGREYPCYGLRARASDQGQQPHTSTEAMASDYIRELRAIQPQGPYLLVGECVGGIVAYEMAQQLLAQGQRVALLALLDTPRPTLGRQLEFSWRQLRDRVLGSRKSLIERMIRHWRQPAERGLRERMRHFFSKSHRFAQKLASVSYLKQTPPEEEALKKMWHDEVLRTGYVRTLFRYRPKRYRGRITILVNEVDARKSPDTGWQRLAAGGLTIHTVPGNHFSYIRDHSRDAAETMRECLDKAMKDFI